MTKFVKKFIGFYVVALLILASFLTGLLFSQEPGAVRNVSAPFGELLNKEKIPQHLSRDVDFQLFWQVWDMVRQKYVKQPVLETKLFYGALAGIVAALEDPYSVFLDPATARKFSEELAGVFDGIGAEIGIKKDQLMVIAPLAGTPASKAGLRSKDRILAIDKVETLGMLLDEAVLRIRGPRGSEVVLTIMRDGFEKPQDFKIIRDTINVASVKWEMKGKKKDIGYIDIYHFNSDTVIKFNDAAREIVLKNPKGVILDLRNNPGGLLDIAVRVASVWLEDSVVVREEFRDQETKEYKSWGQPWLKDTKTIVLVNEGSASGSEIVAGALQDYDKAIIVGEKTFGKGTVQELETLKDGSAVKVTVARWLTPKGRVIEEEGVAPDIEVKLTPDDFSNDRDPQLDKAIELLSKD